MSLMTDRYLIKIKKKRKSKLTDLKPYFNGPNNCHLNLNHSPIKYCMKFYRLELIQMNIISIYL